MRKYGIVFNVTYLIKRKLANDPTGDRTVRRGGWAKGNSWEELKGRGRRRNRQIEPQGTRAHRWPNRNHKKSKSKEKKNAPRICHSHHLPTIANDTLRWHIQRRIKKNNKNTIWKNKKSNPAKKRERVKWYANCGEESDGRGTVPLSGTVSFFFYFSFFGHCFPSNFPPGPFQVCPLLWPPLSLFLPSKVGSAAVRFALSSALDGDLANATRSLRFFSHFSTQSAPLPPAAPSPATHCKRRRVPSILADQLASVSQPAIHPSIRVHQTCGPTTYPHSVAHSISYILLGEKNSSAVNSAREAGFQMNRLFQKRTHSTFLRYVYDELCMG